MTSERTSPEADPTLRLRRLESSDRAAVSRLLTGARFQRRSTFSGVHELHPVDWSERRRTFVVEAGHTLLGTTELLRDDDDPDTWELSLALTHEGSGDGGRCVAATLFYAFEVLGADSVWFWSADDNAAVQRLAQRYGFSQLNLIRLPGGAKAHVYELVNRTYQTHATGAFAHCLATPVTVDDGRDGWRGTAEGFIRGR